MGNIFQRGILIKEIRYAKMTVILINMGAKAQLTSVVIFLVSKSPKKETKISALALKIGEIIKSRQITITN